MKQHLNTLFVQTQGAYLAKEGQAVVVRHQREVKLRVPLHTIGGIVCFGRVSCSPQVMAMCGESGVALTFLTEHGKFLARVSGFTPGNVLLRREQYRRTDDPSATVDIARNIVLAKIANSRTVLLRGARDHPENGDLRALRDAIVHLGRCASAAQRAPTLDALRGAEGEAAKVYFGAFNYLVTAQQADFAFNGRSRRPPLDRINAILSFVYALLAHDSRAACESAGLDPAVGYLHAERPGRAALALDLMEEFRAFLADRLVLSLVNRRQVQPSGFRSVEGGGIELSDDTRKAVLIAYQTRKQEVIRHPFLGESTTVGLLVHLQARLLARCLRGDLDGYPPFLWR